MRAKTKATIEDLYNVPDNRKAELVATLSWFAKSSSIRTSLAGARERSC